MRDILIVLLAAVVLGAYLAFAPDVLKEYARYLVCLVSAWGLAANAQHLH